MKGIKLKKYIYATIMILCTIFLLISCILPEETQKASKVEEISKIPEMIETLIKSSSEPSDFQLQYQMLNKEIFGRNLILWYTDEMKEEVYEYSEEVKGEFVEVQNAGNSFPPELITAFEEMLYQSFDYNMDKSFWEDIEKSIYFEATKKFSSDKFELDMEEMKRLFPELEDPEVEMASEYDAYKLVSGRENCVNMFHFNMTPDQDNYVIAESSGGSNGAMMIELTKLENDEFVIISSFETQNNGYGRVIQYGEGFYYVFIEYNYNLKNYDGIRIHKLGENAAEDNLLIKYLPYNYVWKNVYMTTDGESLNTYLEGIKGDITSDTYLENGLAKDVDVFCGDEIKDEDFGVQNVDEFYFSSHYHKADFANIGVPIYMRKSNFIPSDYRNVWQFKCRFFLQNPENDSVWELDQMEIGASGAVPYQDRLVLVQMWFKEIEGKVYTLCLYHAFDYNYVLNVYAIEGDKAEQIRTDILSPQRQFVLTEGERFFSG